MAQQSQRGSALRRRQQQNLGLRPAFGVEPECTDAAASVADSTGDFVESVAPAAAGTTPS